MPSKQINFRYEVLAGTGVELSWRLRNPGVLTKILMYFPEGCNCVVQTRMLLSNQFEGGIRQVTPIGGTYIALDNIICEFVLDEDVAKGDKIFVQFNNTGAEDHIMTVVVTHYHDISEEERLSRRGGKSHTKKTPVKGIKKRPMTHNELSAEITKRRVERG